jgi:S1-C subfamily serine protease
MNVVKIVLALLIIVTCNAFGSEYSQMRNVVIPILVTDTNPPNKREVIVTGSGVVFAPRYIITAAHVIPKDNKFLLFRYIDKNTEPMQLKVVKIDRAADLALLTGNFNCPCATFSSTEPIIDQSVYAVSFPMFSNFRLQILSLGNMQGISNTFFATTTISAPGSSGGGLFIKENDVFKWVGVIDAVGRYNDGDYEQLQTWITFSVPNTTIKNFLTSTPAYRYLE